MDGRSVTGAREVLVNPSAFEAGDAENVEAGSSGAGRSGQRDAGQCVLKGTGTAREAPEAALPGEAYSPGEDRSGRRLEAGSDSARERAIESASAMDVETQSGSSTST